MSLDVDQRRRFVHGVPLSGSAGGSYTGHFTVLLLGRDLRVEAKAGAKGFGTLYAWLEGRDALVVKADRKPPLVVLPLALALDVMWAAEMGAKPTAER